MDRATGLVTPVVCSRCGNGRLTPAEAGMRCIGCGASFPVRNGVLDMLDTNPILERERAGNRLIVQEERPTANREWLLALPGAFAGTAEYRASMADHDFIADLVRAADCLDLPAGAVVVELGAGCCWTSWRLAKRGWKVAATDISEEDYVGLRSGAVFMDEYGVHFDRILSGMGSRWPYADGTVDGVLANCSIHHADNLEAVFQEAARVLRPGGRFSFVEATTGIVVRSDRHFGEHEKEHYGWNEHLYPIGVYQRVARKAGLRFRYEPAPSTKKKLEAVLTGWLPQGPGLKFKLARQAGPILRQPFVRSLLLGRGYPLVNRFIGTQIIGVAEKPR